MNDRTAEATAIVLLDSQGNFGWHKAQQRALDQLHRERYAELERQARAAESELLAMLDAEEKSAKKAASKQQRKRARRKQKQQQQQQQQQVQVLLP